MAKPRCKCAKDDRHEAYVLSKKVRGKTVTTHIPRDLLDEVRSWAEAQKRIKIKPCLCRRVRGDRCLVRQKRGMACPRS